MKRIKKENAVMICVIALIAALSVFFVVSMKKNAADIAGRDTVLTVSSSAGTDSPVDTGTGTGPVAGKKNEKTDTVKPDTGTDPSEKVSDEVIAEEPVTSEPETEKQVPETGSGETEKTETAVEKDPSETRSPEKISARDTTSAPPSEEEEPSLSCSISIRCDTVLKNMDRLEDAKIPYVPPDGCILPAVAVDIEDGESVFEVLKYVCDTYGIQFEFSWTPIYNSSYIEGIGYLYEFDCGDESGWIYTVNGTAPNYGCSEYKLHGGEVVAWSYSCEGYGADVGAGW